jgi:restriction system protein
MAIPKYDELYKEILQALADGETLSNAALYGHVARQKGVTPEERAELLPSGIRPIFDDRVAWTRTYLKQAGLLAYPKRGHSCLTAEGRKVLDENPAVLNNAYLMRYESFRSFVSPISHTHAEAILPSLPESETDSTPQEQMDHAIKHINLSLGDDLLSEIMQQNPEFFERLVVRLLLKMGCGSSRDEAGFVTQRSRDEGIDGIIKEDKLGFSNIYIQAKRWDRERMISRPEIQKFKGAIVGATEKGLFITTAKFSEDAERYAKAQHIVLVDGARLVSLMIEHDVGVSAVQSYTIKKVDADFFVE